MLGSVAGGAILGMRSRFEFTSLVVDCVCAYASISKEGEGGTKQKRDMYDSAMCNVGGKMGTAVISMAALAATSAAIDLSNHSLRGDGFQDAASPVRRVFPYEQ